MEAWSAPCHILTSTLAATTEPTYVGSVEEPIILASALKHGAEEEDILHALRHGEEWGEIGDGLIMYVGPARSAVELLEIGLAVPWHDDIAVVHAMPARSKFLFRR